MKSFILKNKKIVALAILVVGITVSGYIILKAGSTPNAPETFPALKNNIDSAGFSQNLNFSRKPLPNLTIDFTDASLEKLIEDNQAAIASGAKNLSDIKLLPNQVDINQLISKIIDNDAASEIINISEFNINASNSKETQIAYLLFVDHLLRDGETTSINESLTTYFEQMAAQFEKKAEILKIINVPSSWLAIHKNLIEFFLKQKNIYLSLAAAEKDPLRFIIASKRILLNDPENEFKKIKELINQKIKDEKLI